MSLVGTRPPTVDEWEQYELHHRSRMSTKPGMLGRLLFMEEAELEKICELADLNTVSILEFLREK